MAESLTPEARRDILETFPNPYPDRWYSIEHVQPEFTSTCPKTHQPDFGTITVRYIADATCVELKSLKFYYQSYRNDGVFYEDVVNRIAEDLVAVLDPHELAVEGRFTPRGGMHSTILVEYAKDGGDVDD